MVSGVYLEEGQQYVSKNHSSWRKRVIVLMLGAVAAVASTWFLQKYFALEINQLAARLSPPPTRQQIESRRLRKIAGWFSRDCGHVPRHIDPDAAIACANEALKSGKRFRVSFDYAGLDSGVTTGLAMGSQHRVYEVVTDELAGSQFAPLSKHVIDVRVTACDSAPVERVAPHAERFLTCRPN